jgi:hypothetical protein
MAEFVLASMDGSPWKAQRNLANIWFKVIKHLAKKNAPGEGLAPGHSQLAPGLPEVAPGQGLAPGHSQPIPISEFPLAAH